MPEGVGMNVGQIILGTEAIQPRRNAVRVHPGAVVPYMTTSASLTCSLSDPFMIVKGCRFNRYELSTSA